MVHGVTQSQTRLKRLSTHACIKTRAHWPELVIWPQLLQRSPCSSFKDAEVPEGQETWVLVHPSNAQDKQIEDRGNGIGQDGRIGLGIKKQEQEQSQVDHTGIFSFMTLQMLGHVLRSNCKMHFQVGVRGGGKSLQVTASERKMCLERKVRLFMTSDPVITQGSPLVSSQSKKIF